MDDVGNMAESPPVATREEQAAPPEDTFVKGFFLQHLLGTAHSAFVQHPDVSTAVATEVDLTR